MSGRQRVRAHWQRIHGKRTRIRAYTRYDNMLHAEIWTVFERVSRERMRIAGFLTAMQVMARTGQEAEHLVGCDDVPEARERLKDAIRRQYVDGNMIDVDTDSRCWAPKVRDVYRTSKADAPRQQSPIVEWVPQ